MLWALAVFETMQGELAALLVGLCGNLQIASFSADALRTLFAASLAMQAQPDAHRLSLPAGLTQHAELAWRESLADARPSQVCSSCNHRLSQ